MASTSLKFFVNALLLFAQLLCIEIVAASTTDILTYKLPTASKFLYLNSFGVDPESDEKLVRYLRLDLSDLFIKQLSESECAIVKGKLRIVLNNVIFETRFFVEPKTQGKRVSLLAGNLPMDSEGSLVIELEQKTAACMGLRFPYVYGGIRFEFRRLQDLLDVLSRNTPEEVH